MSICDLGMESKVSGGEIVIKVQDDNPLIMLANSLPWAEMAKIVTEDIKNTAKKNYRKGRKLYLRIHLGAYLLQQIFNLTDRETEFSIANNAVYQIFCASKVFSKNWHIPDHTSIEKFRSRLSCETQKNLANLITVTAAKFGFADPAHIDVDSTIQEANMTYPTDAKMLRKLGDITAKVGNALKEKFKDIGEKITANIKNIRSLARDCFFISKKAMKEQKNECLKKLLESVSSPLLSVIEICEKLTAEEMKKMKWNIKDTILQLLKHGKSYLESVKHFINTGKAIAGKKLAFHLEEVVCLSKNKEDKQYYFGRNIQLVRASNFLLVTKSENPVMNDKKSLISVIKTHEELFGENQIISIATDKGYYSASNIKEAEKKKIKQIGIQAPCNVKRDLSNLSTEESNKLRNRRAGIEPLIGQAKQGGQLGKSRMKKDKSIESSAYTAVLGFNARQMMNRLQDREKENKQKMAS